MIKLFLHRAGVAQLVERQPSKLNVAGSSPVSRSNLLNKRKDEETFWGVLLKVFIFLTYGDCSGMNVVTGGNLG